VKAIGDEPYILTHGTERQSYCMILVSVTEEEQAAIKQKTGTDPVVVKIGKRTLVALPLEAKALAGTLDKKHYDADQKRWTSTIAISRYK